MRSDPRSSDCIREALRSTLPGRRSTPSRAGAAQRALAATFAAALTLPGLAHAGASQGSFIVTASVLAVCEMTATALHFPNYLPGSGTTLHAMATVSIQCTNGTDHPTLALNAGSSGGSMVNRIMLGPGGSRLEYNLYTSPSYSTVFGDGTGGSSTLPVTIPRDAFTTPVQVNVYGQLLDSAANQAAAAGNYSDTVTATLTY